MRWPATNHKEVDDARKDQPRKCRRPARVHSPGGGPPRRGLILEVLGAAGHEHYRVRWTDEHESIYYPADGAVIVPPNPAAE